jgi:uncharacterized protein (DUF302 family)
VPGDELPAAGAPCAGDAPEGLVLRISDAALAVTCARLDAALDARGIVPFARIDHAALARQAGLTLGPAMVVIFGNPALGTPLMRLAPLLAIDLPLRLLVCEQDDRVLIAYTDPMWRAGRYGLSAEHPVWGQMAEVLSGLTAHAAGLAG